MTRAFLVDPGAPLIFATGHEFEVTGIDARRVSTHMVRLMPERDRPAVVDLPGDVVAAADFLPDAHDRVAVFVDGALPTPAAGRRLDAVAEQIVEKAGQEEQFQRLIAWPSSAQNQSS